MVSVLLEEFGIGNSQYIMIKYVMPDLIARGRQGCCHSGSSGLTGGEAENVFPAGTRTQSTHMHHTYTYTDRRLAVHVTGGHSGHSQNTGSTNGLILLPSLAEQDRGPLMGVYIHTHQVHPSSSKVYSPQLMAPGRRSSQDCSPILVAGTTVPRQIDR